MFFELNIIHILKIRKSQIRKVKQFNIIIIFNTRGEIETWKYKITYLQCHAKSLEKCLLHYIAQ